MEQWKTIDEYPNYMVSNMGNVINVKTNKILKPIFCGGGYSDVGLCNNGISKRFKIHRLVAQAFIPNPDNLPQVNHINEDKTDNRVENLEWCDVRYNINYGTRSKRQSEKLSKPICQYNLNGSLIRIWKGSRDIERELGFYSGSIIRCCKGKRNKANGFIWKYVA